MGPGAARAQLPSVSPGPAPGRKLPSFAPPPTCFRGVHFRADMADHRPLPAFKSGHPRAHVRDLRGADQGRRKRATAATVIAGVFRRSRNAPGQPRGPTKRQKGGVAEAGRSTTGGIGPEPRAAARDRNRVTTLDVFRKTSVSPADLLSSRLLGSHQASAVRHGYAVQGRFGGGWAQTPGRGSWVCTPLTRRCSA